MSNYHLSKDKQIAVTAALAEGNSIRSIERMTGIARDTIVRLGVRVGQGCARLLDQKMRNLDCNRIELDEVWSYIGKKVPIFVKMTIRPLVMCAGSSLRKSSRRPPVPSWCRKRNCQRGGGILQTAAARSRRRR